jgi:DNA-binding transcriptional MerR regulator
MNLISIGKFSRLTGLSVRALRIYAAEGLLEPQFIDPTTGYRFYHTSQAAIAEKIKNLRQCEMSLEQILQLLKQPRNAHTLLQQHRDFVQERMNHHLTMLHHLDVLLSHTQRPFEVAYRDTKAQAVVYLCQAMDFNKRASYAEIGTAIGQLYEIIRGAQLQIGGAPFRVYAAEPQETPFEVAICIPILGESSTLAKHHHTILPARRYAYTIHTGEYTGVQATLCGLLTQLKANKLNIAGQVHETYLEHPLSVSDPRLYRTELAIPIA